MDPVDLVFAVEARSSLYFLSWHSGHAPGGEDDLDSFEASPQREPAGDWAKHIAQPLNFEGGFQCELGAATREPVSLSGRHSSEETHASLLSIHTLGRFAIMRDGRAMSFNGKSPRKPLELLMALIALGRPEIHTDALIRAVWPDESSFDPRNLFYNTLHRLRALLECRDALVLGDEKLSLNPQRCWVDAWAFDKLAGINLGDAGIAMAPTADDALRLYQGQFLQCEAPHAWLLGYRERLHSRFLRLVFREGERLESLQSWDAAAEWYERGLEIDPLAERLHRRLIVGHHKCGEEAEALRVYRRCREVLWRLLGVVPSPATEACANAIRSGAPPS